MNRFKINEEKIDKLAHLAVKRGVGLQRGQNLLITAPIESLPLVRKISEHAYKEGAHIVTPFFTDSDITLSRFKYAPEESFDNSTDWLFRGMGEAFDNNTARMAIAAGSAIAVTPLEIFSDLEGSIVLPGTSSSDIKGGIMSISERSLTESKEKITLLRDKFQWNKISKKYEKLIY